MTDARTRLSAISALAAKAGALGRIIERGKRGADLKEWGLRHPPPDPGSSLVVDDDGFMTQIGGLVHITAVFPIMNATDSLAAAAELIDGRPTSRNAHTASLLALCRSALESASITVWLLSPIERAERRARCLGFTQAELLAQKSFHAAERQWFEREPARQSQPIYPKFQEHVRLHEIRMTMLDNQTKKRPPNPSDLPSEAGKWIDQHPPSHDHDLYANGFAHGVSPVLHAWFRIDPWVQVAGGLRSDRRTGDIRHGGRWIGRCSWHGRVRRGALRSPGAAPTTTEPAKAALSKSSSADDRRLVDTV